MLTLKINCQETEFDTVYTGTTHPVPLLTIHKEIFAMTFYPEGLLNLSRNSIFRLNRMISDTFYNSECYISFNQGKLWIKNNEENLIDITHYPKVTIQGYSWEDKSTRIIKLR